MWGRARHRARDGHLLAAMGLRPAQCIAPDQRRRPEPGRPHPIHANPDHYRIQLSGTTLTSRPQMRAGGHYVLLGATNTGVPLAQWTPVLTNTFSGGGTLNFSTNVANPKYPAVFIIAREQKNDGSASQPFPPRGPSVRRSREGLMTCS